MTTSTKNADIIRRSWSVCPVCLKKVPAKLESRAADGIYMSKSCPEHGDFSTRVWGRRFALDEWIEREEPLTQAESGQCDGRCFACDSHGQGTCCCILEVTKRCNLRCTYCFASGGETSEEPSYDELCRAIDVIADKGDGPLIQLSGGEPTLRDDLPELVNYAIKAGCRYTQINTNGIRLAEDEEYVRRLAEAGLDIVFLQFDGTNDDIYRRLRGRDFLETKLQAIANCDRYHIGVTLVPTVVRGVNDDCLGDIVRLAADLFPAVRSVHFQPVTYLGRYPEINDHYTLDDLMGDLCDQTGIPDSALLPSRCDHAMCEFHSTFMESSSRQLIPMTDRAFDVRKNRTSAQQNRKYVAEHWGRRIAEAEATEYDFSSRSGDMPLITSERGSMDFDEFARKMKTHTLKISAMAFQDAMNLDLERLHRCSLHIYDNGKLIPFCAKYLTAIK